MANLKNKADLESVGGGDVFAPPAHLLVIAEEDPKHAHHHEHMERVRIDKPEMQALLASIREFGWRKSKTIPVYRDGTRWVVSDGRRSLTCVRIENARRKTEKDPRGPIRPRVVLDDDPALTTTIANEMREGDPPIVRGRRFVDLRETMGAKAAAAALGLSLADANALALIIATPNAALHAAVNGKHVPIDVGARAARHGTAAVEKVLSDAKDPTTGKVTPERATAASKANHVPRPRGMNRDEIAALATVAAERATWTGEQVQELLLYTTTGAQRGEDAPPMSTAVAKATAAAETAAKEARRAAKGGAP